MEPNQQSNSANNLKKFTIVIVEDDEGLGKLIQVKLQREGFAAKLYETGNDALSNIKGKTNEILLVDYKLPDMTGQELIKKLIKKHGFTPNFITLTGYGNEKVAVEMMKLGSHDYIVKEPKFLEALTEKLKHVYQNIENEHKLTETEAHLEKNIELLKETGEMARVGGWEVDLNTNQVYWTDTTKRIHEVPDDYIPTLEEAIKFFPGESGTHLENAVNKAIQKGTGYDLELQFVTAKGRELWVHTIGKATIKNKKCIRLHGTFQDITQRKEAEHELKVSNAILKRTEEIAHVGSWEWDVATDTVTWSDELFRIFKINPKKGAPSYADHPRIYTPKSMKKLDEAVQQCLKWGEPYELDLEIIKGDGKRAFCTGRGFAKKDTNGKVVRLFGSFQDITERVNAEKIIKESEEKFRSTVESISDGFFVLETKKLIVSYFNTEAEKLLHRKADEVLGRPLFESFPEAKGSIFEKKYNQAFKNKNAVSFETYFGIEPFTNWYDVRVYPKDEKLSVFFRVITDRIKAEELLKAQNQQLKAFNQQLTASEQQYKAANQQLAASEQQLRAANQQLAANEQQLQAANQQLVAHEQELINKKEIAERYLNIAAEIILNLDKQGRIVLLNESGYQLLGYEKGELEGKNWFDTCLPESTSKTLKKEFKKLMSGQTEGLTNYQNPVKTKSGEIKSIRWYNHILKNKEGDIEGALSSGEDITEYLKAEEKLAASERKYRSIMDNSSSPIFIKDIKGKYLYVNRKFEVVHGISNDEIQAMTDVDLFNEQLAKQFRKNDKEIIESGEAKNFEEQVIWEGKIKTVLSNRFPLRDKHGKIYAICGIATDISERKNAELEIRKAKEAAEIREERFRKAQEAGHIGSWEFNFETNEFWGSDEGIRIYNLDPNKKEFPAEEVMNIVVEKDRELVNQAMVDLVTENKQYDIVFEITPKNTSDRKTIHSMAELQRDKNGNPLKVTGVLRDITEQKMLEKQLIAAKEKAEEADQLKSAFLANMSHEIRTPMNGILGFTNLLKNPNLSEERHLKFIDIIQKSGNRMLETVNALIDISRIETGQVEVVLEEVKINNEVQSLYDFFKVEAQQKGLEFLLEDKLGANQNFILTDKNKFNSILSNLIKNAIKYTDEGYIKIGLEKEDGWLYFYVEDSGIGVPKDRQQAIFNRFEQADVKDTRAFQGSGLGLAIVKAYVQMLQGEVGVDSEEGKGSVFWVKLPLTKKSFDSPKKDDLKIMGKTGLSDLKILIAEDDDISTKHFSILLSGIASKLLYSGTGKETIELCKQHPDIDIVLMDVKMPDINGYQATKEIRKFNKDVIIIAQTAYALEGERNRAISFGCDDYISKPIEKDELFRVLLKTLQNK